MVVAFRRFSSFDRCFSSFSSRLRSFFERVTGRVMSSSSSSQSSQSSSEDSTTGSSNSSSLISGTSSSQSSSTCLDDSSAAAPSSESSIAVRASESTSSATSFTRFLNRSKRPMFSPNHPRLVRCQTYCLCVALASMLGSLLLRAVIRFRSQLWMVRVEFVLLLLQ